MNYDRDFTDSKIGVIEDKLVQLFELGLIDNSLYKKLLHFSQNKDVLIYEDLFLIVEKIFSN